MKKLMTAGVAAASIAGASLVVAAVNPLGIAGAQTSSGTPSTTAPDGEHSRGQRLEERRAKLEERLQKAVADGKLTQEQADAMRQRGAEKVAKVRERAAAGVKRVAGATLEEVSTLLGVPKEDVVAQLKEGKGLADIAGPQTQALIDALAAKADARIDAAVADGKLDAAKATELKTKTKDRITKMVNTAPGPRGFGPKGPLAGRGPAAPTN